LATNKSPARSLKSAKTKDNFLFAVAAFAVEASDRIVTNAIDSVLLKRFKKFDHIAHPLSSHGVAIGR
jgi:hypothetical protein